MSPLLPDELRAEAEELGLRLIAPGAARKTLMAASMANRIAAGAIVQARAGDPAHALWVHREVTKAAAKTLGRLPPAYQRLFLAADRKQGR